MGYERHKNDWKNLVFTVPQYMCLGCWGKTCSLVVVVFGDSIASICRREQICIKPAETAWYGLFTRSESHVYPSVWVLLCLLTSWILFHVYAESYCSVNCSFNFCQLSFWNYVMFDWDWLPVILISRLLPCITHAQHFQTRQIHSQLLFGLGRC